jgi:hypothetical protein
MTPAQLLLMFDYRNCVARAAEICGGHERLAGRVNASVEDVVLWALGLKEPYLTQMVRMLELLRAAGRAAECAGTKPRGGS